MTHDTFQLPDVWHTTQQRIYRCRPSRQRYHRSQPTSPDPLTSRSTCNPKVVPGRALTPLPCRTEICLGMAANCREGKGTEGKVHDEGGQALEWVAQTGHRASTTGDAQSPAGAALDQLLQSTQRACVLPAPSLLLELGRCNSVPSAPQASRSK